MKKSSEGISTYGTKGITNYPHKGHQDRMPKTDLPYPDEFETGEPPTDERGGGGVGVSNEAMLIAEIEGVDEVLREQIEEKLDEFLAVIANLSPQDRDMVVEKLVKLLVSIKNVTESDKLNIEQRLRAMERWLNGFLDGTEKIRSEADSKD